VRHFSIKLSVQSKLFYLHVLLSLLKWRLFMESVLYLKNHDCMPDTVLCNMLPYSTVFWVFWVFFTIRIHNTVGEGVVSRR
jgi:hypothetical protein